MPVFPAVFPLPPVVQYGPDVDEQKMQYISNKY